MTNLSVQWKVESSAISLIPHFTDGVMCLYQKRLKKNRGSFIEVIRSSIYPRCPYFLLTSPSLFSKYLPRPLLPTNTGPPFLTLNPLTKESLKKRTSLHVGLQFYRYRRRADSILVGRIFILILPNRRRISPKLV